MKATLLILALLAALGGGAWWMWRDAIPQVKVEIVSRGTVKNSSPGRVKVSPERPHSLTCPSEGRVETVIMEPNSPGLPVKAGETLIQLETDEIRLNLDEIQAGLKAAEARLATESELSVKAASMRRDLVDFRKLAEEGRYPKAELRNKEDELKGIEALLSKEAIDLKERVDTFRARKGQAQTQLDNLSIRSPFDGILTEVFVFPGDQVRKGQALGVLHSRQRLIRVTLNEEDFQGVEVNQTVAVSFLSHGNQVFPGKVARLSKVLDSANRRHLFVDLEGGHDQFAAGISGEAEIIKASKKNVILVPRRALVGEKVCVWKDGVLEIRKVTVGHRNLLTAEVIEGLSEDEQVVVETPHLYRDGQRARLAESRK